MNISVVIPVYNSEASLEPLAERLKPVLEKLAERFEVVFVNDGSRDGSWEVVAGLARKHPWIVGLNLMRNYGQHNALLCGIRQACHEIIVTMDDDLQHPPEEIPKLVEKIAEGYDVVYGSPRTEVHDPLRNASSRLIKLVLQLAIGVEVARQTSAFRAFRTQAREAFSHYTGTYVSIDVLLTWATTRFGSVTVDHQPRTVGRSQYTFRKLLLHALNMITGFSVLPLRLASVLGFAFTLFGIAVFVFVVGRYLISGTSVAGFPFLAAIVTIFSGVQLFTLGVIGEYLARMHFRLQERPSYTLRECVGNAAPGEADDSG